MGTIKTTNIEPIADNGTVTLGSSGDTFTVPSGVTVNMSSATQTGVGGANTPVFRAYLNANQSISNNADTTVVFNAESFDPQSTFDTSTGRFTPGVSGKYFLHANVKLSATNDGGIFDIYLRKNSSTQSAFRYRGSGSGDVAISITDIAESDTDDYFYIMVYQATGSSINANGGENITHFSGYKVIE